MLRFRVYIDTSVIGGYFDDEFSKYSILLFNDFTSGKKIAVFSNLTLRELKHAPENARKKFDEIPGEYGSLFNPESEFERLS
jgi:hypothetical protein